MKRAKDSENFPPNQAEPSKLPAIETALALSPASSESQEVGLSG